MFTFIIIIIYHLHGCLCCLLLPSQLNRIVNALMKGNPHNNQSKTPPNGPGTFLIFCTAGGHQNRNVRSTGRRIVHAFVEKTHMSNSQQTPTNQPTTNRKLKLVLLHLSTCKPPTVCMYKSINSTMAAILVFQIPCFVCMYEYLMIRGQLRKKTSKNW